MSIKNLKKVFPYVIFSLNEEICRPMFNYLIKSWGLNAQPCSLNIFFIKEWHTIHIVPI